MVEAYLTYQLLSNTPHIPNKDNGHYFSTNFIFFIKRPVFIKYSKKPFKKRLHVFYKRAWWIKRLHFLLQCKGWYLFGRWYEHFLMKEWKPNILKETVLGFAIVEDSSYNSPKWCMFTYQDVTLMMLF